MVISTIITSIFDVVTVNFFVSDMLILRIKIEHNFKDIQTYVKIKYSQFIVLHEYLFMQLCEIEIILVNLKYRIQEQDKTGICRIKL